MGRMMERLYGIIFFALGMAILWQGRNLTIGAIRSPGAGFFPALIAGIMLLLSVILMIFPPGKEGKDRAEEQSASAKSVVRIAVVFAALLLYAFFLETLGFLVVNFLLTTLLFVAFGSHRYWVAVLRGLVLTGFAHALFGVLLKSNLPKGIWGF